MITKEQQKIIKSKSKNMMVIAGAGTGKTTTIINRIDYLVKNKIYRKKDIIVISFTNATVNDIRDRLDGVKVMTYHKLALNILGNDVNKIMSEYDVNYIIKEYFNYLISNKMKNKLNYYLDYNKNNLNYFYKRILHTLNIYKANNGNMLFLIKIYFKLFFIRKERYFIELFISFYLFYQHELQSCGAYDFNDLIIKALISKKIIKCKYLIVDEFQDTSNIRMKLLEKIIKDNNAGIMVVGDDYQSIYRFSGSNLSVFINFKKRFKNVETYYLTKTFRNSYELNYVMTNFIMKNKFQINKSIISDKHISKPIVLVYYHDLDKSINHFIKKFSNLMILGRNNIDNNNYPNFYTVHLSKGLEFDNVLIINNKNDILGFPNQISDDKIIRNLINIKEIEFSEERRLFYVAMTRTKNKVFLLVRKNCESIFVKELIRDYNDYISYMEGI